MKYPKLENSSIAIIGLGYVGLPLAIEFGKLTNKRNDINLNIIGFDINQKRINDLNKSFDETKEINNKEFLEVKNLIFTTDSLALQKSDVFIITVPTPIDKSKKPDLIPLKNASILVGNLLKKRAKDTIPIIIYESTVYPGATEEFCIPLIESHSSMVLNKDFVVGYSPERINPGDKIHTLNNVIKVTSGSCDSAANWINKLYSLIIKKGTYKAKSIKIAEAAKVIENTQRDINIALINEFSIIFKKLGIDTLDVLETARTKWNFLPFYPGLVGGHCIGVDPYYLTYRAELTGYHTELILSGRKINDGMGERIAKELILNIVNKGFALNKCRILIMGFTFKENCPDIRNTKVIDIIETLKRYKTAVYIFDPWIKSNEIEKNLGVKVFNKLPNIIKFEAIIGAVKHDEFKSISIEDWKNLIKEKGVLYDIKGMIPRELNAIRI